METVYMFLVRMNRLRLEPIYRLSDACHMELTAFIAIDGLFFTGFLFLQ